MARRAPGFQSARSGAGRRRMVGLEQRLASALAAPVAPTLTPPPRADRAGAGIRSRRAASGADSRPARSRPAGHRRVQPPAAGRHAGARPPGESHAALLAAFRKPAHHPAPHYVSNYFPGQALFLAAGKVALHSAWAGVLAGCAFFLLALYWALRGWMPARWALFGVLLAALRFGIASYWVNAYHGGFVPAAGGALVFGAYARLHRRASVIDGAALGAGPRDSRRDPAVRRRRLSRRLF